MIEIIHRLEKEILYAETPERKIDKINDLGKLLRYIDESKSKEFSEKARTLSVSSPFQDTLYKKGLAYSLTNLCELNFMKGNSRISFSQGNKALRIFQETKDFDGQSWVLSVLGFSHLALGDYTKALNFLLKSNNLARESKNKKYEAISLCYLAGVYANLGDSVKMLETYDQSLKLIEEIDDFIYLAITKNNMAIDYKEMGNFESALKYGLESLQICESHGLHAAENYTLETIGSIYLKMDNIDLARHYLERANDNVTKLGNEYAEIFVLIQLATLPNKQLSHSATEDLKRALFLSEKLKMITEQVIIHKHLSEIYEKEGKPLLALNHYKKFYQIEKIIFGKVNDTKMLKEQLEKAKEEISTLKGIIPICSHCKSIRDDSGYWNQIEAYIQEHSKAEFSHGMCPECAEELYGNEQWYKNRNN